MTVGRQYGQTRRLSYRSNDPFDKIIEQKKGRSLPEHKFYWTFCRWTADNISETLLDTLNIRSISSELVHTLMKTKAGISSTSFDNMTQDDFHNYFDASKRWAADFLIGCNVDDIEDMIREYADAKM